MCNSDDDGYDSDDGANPNPDMECQSNYGTAPMFLSLTLTIPPVTAAVFGLPTSITSANKTSTLPLILIFDADAGPTVD